VLVFDSKLQCLYGFHVVRQGNQWHLL
jgi:hypothetical protein